MVTLVHQPVLSAALAWILQSNKAKDTWGSFGWIMSGRNQQENHGADLKGCRVKMAFYRYYFSIRQLLFYFWELNDHSFHYELDIIWSSQPHGYMYTVVSVVKQMWHVRHRTSWPAGSPLSLPDWHLPHGLNSLIHIYRSMARRHQPKVDNYSLAVPHVADPDGQ